MIIKNEQELFAEELGDLLLALAVWPVVAPLQLDVEELGLVRVVITEYLQVLPISTLKLVAVKN